MSRFPYLTDTVLLRLEMGDQFWVIQAVEVSMVHISPNAMCLICESQWGAFLVFLMDEQSPLDEFIRPLVHDTAAHFGTFSHLPLCWPDAGSILVCVRQVCLKHCLKGFGQRYLSLF